MPPGTYLELHSHSNTGGLMLLSFSQKHIKVGDESGVTLSGKLGPFESQFANWSISVSSLH